MKSLNLAQKQINMELGSVNIKELDYFHFQVMPLDS